MFPVLLRAIQSFHLDRSTRSTAPINGPAGAPQSSVCQSSGTARGSGGQTSRLPHSSGLYPPPPPKLSLAVVVNRHALPTLARRCEICLRRGQTSPWSSHPPAPLSRVRVCIPVWLKMDALTRLTSHHTLSRELLRTWVPWVPSAAASCGYRLLTSECLAGFSSAQPEAEAEAKAESRILLLLLLLLRLAAGPVRGRTVNMGPVKGSP